MVLSEPMTEAAALVAAGRFDAALRLLEPLPEHLSGRHGLLGAAHLGRKHAASALEHLTQALAESQDDGGVAMLLGRAHLLANDPGAAIRVFEGLCRTEPERPGLAEALAGAYRRDARYADSIALVEATPVPTDQMLYEKAMSLNSLGEGPRALATWDALLARAPDLAAAWYGSHAPALDLSGQTEAERRLERACACPKANGKYQAMGAAYDLLTGRPPRSFNRRHAHVVESAAALLPDLDPDVRLFGMAASLLRWALGQARLAGLTLEFGVRRGASLAVVAAQAGQEVHGFDSFEGLPEDWGATQRGVLTTGLALPEVADNARLHPGWFEDTLPAFLACHCGPVRFANIDSDIYSSARTVLTHLAPRIVAGTVLVFDEFIGNRSWRDDEYKAFREFAQTFAVRSRVIAVNPACKQVALLVL